MTSELTGYDRNALGVRTVGPQELEFAAGCSSAFMAEVSPAFREKCCTIDLPTILGCVMAHEIGRLLLGSNHSATGIMKAHWGRKPVRESRETYFSPSNSQN